MKLDPHRLVVRFWSRTQKGKPNACWPWIGGITRGYGYFFDYGKMILAHRFAYGLAKGPIPPGKQIHHLCAMKLCMNPDHLTTLSGAGHMEEHRSQITAGIRARIKSRTHCKHGHEYTPENTGYDRYGWRVCRTCMRDWMRLHYKPVPPEKRKRFKDHCPHGHPYPENARFRPDGSKYCAECNRLRAKAHYRRTHLKRLVTSAAES